MGAGKKTIVLQIVKGAKKAFDEKGNLLNENQEMTLTYGDTQFAKHVANIAYWGVCEVNVVKMLEEQKDGDSKATKQVEIEVTQEVKDEVAKLWKPTLAATEQTAEQKQIAELTARLDALTKGTAKTEIKTEAKAEAKKEEPKAEDKKEEVKTETSKEDLADAQAKYQAKFKKAVPNVKKQDLNWILKEVNK